ncbi:rCG37583 [Rattus norvegicus]|uniref:RCG37583 n=1 Tax=Rattus norvegicus TaxID=10116 RepID=A6K7W9_RAT|nr:rCG37583 [Rattus norvegicus]
MRAVSGGTWRAADSATRGSPAVS